MLPNKIIEDIARRVARDEMSRGSREEDILRRKIDTLAENQRNLAEGVADIDEELASVINNPPKSFLVNGAFELDTNNDGVADDWEFGGTASSKSAGMAEAAVYGTKCQRITIGSDNIVVGGTAYIKQTVPINAGRRYTFSVFHKDDGVEQMDYYIMIRKIYADATPSDIVLHSESYTDWGHRVSATFDGDEGIVEAEIYIGISVSEAGIGASAWFDMAILNFGSHPIPPIAVVPEIIKREFSDSLFQIAVESDPVPVMGELGDLLVDDELGAEFASAPTITFTFPMSWFFDMVRLFPSVDVGFYVQAYDNGINEWRNVIGDPSNFQPATGMETNIVKFSRMTVTNKLRIIFNSPLTLYRLKFWTITFADEILAQLIQANQIAAIDADFSTITAGGGKFRLDSLGLVATDGTNVTIDVNFATGGAFFRGSVEAGVLILPGAPPE